MFTFFVSGFVRKITISDTGGETHHPTDLKNSLSFRFDPQDTPKVVPCRQSVSAVLSSSSFAQTLPDTRRPWVRLRSDSLGHAVEADAATFHFPIEAATVDSFVKELERMAAKATESAFLKSAA